MTAQAEIQFLGLQKTSCNDYPGTIAATVFTAGCNLRCPFCHNSRLIKLPDTSPDGDLDSAREDLLPLGSILSWLKSRAKILDGVCISGGEPLMFTNIHSLIKQIKQIGYRVKIDTNGTFPEKLKEIIKDIDYIAMDLKTTFNNYRAVGFNGSVDILKKSINIIMNSQKDYEFRTTLIPGFSGYEEITELIKYIPGALKYCLNRFNPADPFNSQWREKEPVTTAQALKIKKMIETAGIQTRLSGYHL